MQVHSAPPFKSSATSRTQALLAPWVIHQRSLKQHTYQVQQFQVAASFV